MTERSKSQSRKVKRARRYKMFFKNKKITKKKSLFRFKKLPLIFLVRKRGIIFWSFKTFYMLRFFKFFSGGLRFHNVHRLLSRRLA